MTKDMFDALRELKQLAEELKELDLEKTERDEQKIVNCCDGCLSGMPIQEGIHIYDGKHHMFCSASNYNSNSSADLEKKDD